MLSLVTATSLALSTGFGLSPGACLLPHIGGGPDVYEHDEMMGSRNRGDPHAALLQAPVRQTPAVPSRRHHLLAAAAAATVCTAPAANAASGPAVDLVVTVGELAIQARALQFYVRDTAPASRANYAAMRTRVRRARTEQLQPLLSAMAAAAPDLRICAPELADCDCAPEPRRMAMAARQVEVVRTQLDALDAALADARGFDAIEGEQMRASYVGGGVERALEEICEATDLYLDLAAGRPLMTARLAPVAPDTHATRRTR